MVNMGAGNVKLQLCINQHAQLHTHLYSTIKHLQKLKKDVVLTLSNFMTTDYTSHAIKSTPSFGNIRSKCNTNTLDQGSSVFN